MPDLSSGERAPRGRDSGKKVFSSYTMKRAKKQLYQLREILPGEISRKQGIYTLVLDSEYGSGDVKCISFNSCMQAVVFDLTLKADVRIPLTKPKSDMVYFLYCLRGNSTLSPETLEAPVGLAELQSAILYSRKNSDNYFTAGKDARFVFSFIGINRQRYKDIFKGDFRGLDGRLRQLLDLVQGHENHYHLGNHNLKVGEHLKALHKHNFNHDVSSFLYFEGYCNLILANQIEEFYKHLNSNSNSTSLTREELQRVQEVSDFIKNYPEVQHSIKSLGTRSGLSPNKLQEGFKFMHERTVSDFVRNVRLEKAEELIKNTDLNISEVVYSIGLTSRSYFCKIFKNKYDCSPKAYKNKAGNPLFVSKT